MPKVGGKVPFVIHHVQQSFKTEIYSLLLYVEQRLLRVMSQVFMECNDLICNIHVLESTCIPLVVLLLLLSLLENMGSQVYIKLSAYF
jgi:hypothetical protein